MGTVEAMSAEALDPVLRASAPSLTCIFPAETQSGELACPVHRVLRGWGHLNLGRAGALALTRLCHGRREHRGGPGGTPDLAWGPEKPSWRRCHPPPSLLTACPSLSRYGGLSPQWTTWTQTSRVTSRASAHPCTRLPRRALWRSAMCCCRSVWAPPETTSTPPHPHPAPSWCQQPLHAGWSQHQCRGQAAADTTDGGRGEQPPGRGSLHGAARRLCLQQGAWLDGPRPGSGAGSEVPA